MLSACALAPAGNTIHQRSTQENGHPKVWIGERRIRTNIRSTDEPEPGTRSDTFGAVHRPARPFLLVLGLLTASLPSMAQDDEATVLEDRILSPTVHTVQFFKKGFELAPPVIDLTDLTPVVLRFDDLQSNAEYLNYTVVHCGADWRPSDLVPMQYLAGAQSDVVPGPSSSFNTFQPFLQYTIEFPNALMRPTISGNFALVVYRAGDPDDVVLTRRFLVFEDRVQIDARMLASRDVELRDAMQHIDLTVRYPGINVQDPFNDLQVVVLQNMRWDDARTGLRPKFLRDRELVYDMPPQTLFNGGNEWRNYDMKNLRYATLRVGRITDDGDLYGVQLLPDEPRSIKLYYDVPDLNGRHFVRNDDVDGDPLGADYTHVRFTLHMDAPLTTGNVYVYGGLSGMRCDPAFRMTWNAEAKAYELNALVKQGWVDYCYAWLPPGTSVPDLARLEGSHFQTENDYVVLVYVRDHSLRCDRLLGLKFLNTRRG